MLLPVAGADAEALALVALLVVAGVPGPIGRNVDIRVRKRDALVVERVVRVVAVPGRCLHLSSICPES